LLFDYGGIYDSGFVAKSETRLLIREQYKKNSNFDWKSAKIIWFNFIYPIQ